MYVQRLIVENWKNFKEGETKLQHRLFLIGPNASGKSNFLDIFRFLRDLCISGGGLQAAVEKRGGVSAIRCLAARQHSDITIDVVLKDDDEKGGLWHYRLSFNQDQNRRPIIKEEHVEYNSKEKLNRPDPDDKADTPRLTQTALQQITANRSFRPIVSFLQSVSYQHLIPQVVRDPQGFSSRHISDDPFGRDFLQRVENTPSRIRDSRLNKILGVLKVAAPQLQELSVERDNLGVPHLIGLFEHWRPHAGKQNEAQFSDGTLRLFGLLWSLFEGDGLLLMEEPELSLHSEVVRQLPQLIERVNRYRKVKRQVIISTFSEEMLSEKGIGGEEILRLEPSPEGTLFKSPLDNPDERRLLESGLSIADVVLPKSAPKDVDQLTINFTNGSD
jgi:AAA domain, putative AbiEii toxin, Type IV TA system